MKIPERCNDRPVYLQVLRIRTDLEDAARRSRPCLSAQKVRAILSTSRNHRARIALGGVEVEREEGKGVGVER